jgi:hypothetical protein
LCWLREGGRKSTKAFITMCVWWSKIDYLFHVCILFFFLCTLCEYRTNGFQYTTSSLISRY